MAKLPASQALEAYKNKTIQDLSATLKAKTKASMSRREAISFKEEDEDKPLTASEILREYKATDELRNLQLAKNEMQKYNIPGSVQTYLDEKKRNIKKSQELLKIQNDVIKQQKTSLKALSTDEDIVEAERKALFQRSIRDVSAEKQQSKLLGEEQELFSLRDYDINNTPKNKLSVTKAQDIPYRFYDSTSGDYSEGNFYVTNSTVSDIMENSNFIEKYDLSDKLKELFSPFIVTSKTGDTTQTSIVPENTVEYEKAVQDFILEIAKKDANFRNFYEIKIDEENVIEPEEGYDFKVLNNKVYKVKKTIGQ